MPLRPRILPEPSLLAAAALLLGLATGCRAVEARSYNLEQLHGSDSRHHYHAALENPTEYFFRHVLVRALSGSTKVTVATKDPEELEDPSSDCREQLGLLAELDPADRLVRARTIEWSARLAAEDGSALSRELALTILARSAPALGRIQPRPLARERTPAGPLALSNALSGLVAASQPLFGTDAWDATAAADFEAALELVRTLDYDLAGARRALRATSDLADHLGWRQARERGLGALVEELERTCIARALAAGLADEHALVQAAAIEASAAVAGHGLLAGLLLRAATEPATPPLVVERILLGLRAGGLVRVAPEPGAPDGEELVETQLEALYRLALEHPEPALRVQAMAALTDLSGSGISSLREEDWKAWWDGRQRARRSPALGAAGP